MARDQSGARFPCVDLPLAHSFGSGKLAGYDGDRDDHAGTPQPTTRVPEAWAVSPKTKGRREADLNAPRQVTKAWFRLRVIVRGRSHGAVD
jgi:hypothetical protein